MQGIVRAVARTASHTISKYGVEAIRLVAGSGVEGDVHQRSAKRQVHLIHAEFLAELRAMGYDLAPGEMGENITTEGVALLSLPAAARLRLGAEAILEVTGLRHPCAQLDKLRPGLRAATLDRDAQGKLVRKAGVMAIVVTGGEVRAGDGIEVLLPRLPHKTLAPV